MKLTARLALSQLKINKRRTIWTFIGVMLSSAMLTTIYGLGFGTGMDWVNRVTRNSDFRASYYAVITSIAMVLSAFVLAISVIVISNAFRVSASERMSQFGILKSVGATKSQIMQTVIYEGLYLTILGIPVGILIGLGVQFMSIGLINDVIEPMLSYEDIVSGNYIMYFIWSWFALFLAGGVSIFTVFLSAWLPARKASLVPAINAIRGIGEVQIKNKKVRGGMVVQKVFGIEGVMARVFLKRSKRNFLATVIAMSFSVAIFIVAGGFYDQISRYAVIQWGRVDANVGLHVHVDSSRPVDCDDEDYDWSQSFYDEYDVLTLRQCFARVDPGEGARTMDEFNGLHTSLEGILNEGDRIIGTGEGHSMNFTEIHISELSSDFVAARQDWNMGREEEYFELDVRLMVVNDAFARELAELAGVDVGSNILINHSRHWLEDGRVIDTDILDFSYQTLSLSAWSDDLVEELRGGLSEDSEIELHGQLTPETAPSEFGIGGPWGLSVIVPEANLLAMNWFVQTHDSAGIAEAGEDLLFDYFDEGTVSVRAVDFDLEEAMTRNTIGLVMFFVFVFVGTLILIGLTNVISTISENVKSRASEFAVLQSVGMTSSGIKRMLNLESVFSSLRALVIGVPLGILGSFGVYLAMRNVGVFSFNFVPWLWVISSVLAIFLVTWITMRYAANRLKDRNVIETIRAGSGR